MENYAKILESYMIANEGTEELIERTEPSKLSINFFNKPNFVQLRYDGISRANAEPVLKSFIKNSKSVSSKIEKEFCRICNIFNEDPGYTGIPANSIKKYSDIKDLSLKSIEIYKDKYNSTNDVVIILKGKYVIDDEHGWSIGITSNGYWDGTIRQYSDDYYDYLKDDKNPWTRYQKSKTMKVF